MGVGLRVRGEVGGGCLGWFGGREGEGLGDLGGGWMMLARGERRV